MDVTSTAMLQSMGMDKKRHKKTGTNKPC